MTADASVAFAVGSGVAIVGSRSIALLAGAPDALVHSLWGLADADSDIDDMLEEVTRFGLRSVSSFALLRLEDQGMRVVVRGAVIAQIHSDTGPGNFSAHGVKTWAEHYIDGASSFRLSIDGDNASDLPYFVQRGVVPAGALSGPVTAERATADGESATADRESATVTAGESTPSAAVEPDEPLPLGEPSADERIGLPDGRESPPSGATAIGTSAGGGEAPSPPLPAPRQAAPPPPGPPLPSSPVRTAADDTREHQMDDGYDVLFGKTTFRSVSAAAVDIQEDDESGDPDDGPAAIISGVPISSGPPLETLPPMNDPVTDHQGRPGDHDGLTMTAAQLRELRSGASEPVGAPPVASMGGPSVQAVACPSGHFNPTHLSNCRECARPLTGPPQVIARPWLGRLVLSSGETVELTRPVIIGRNPKVEGRLQSEVPQTVRLDVGQALSRSHVMVRLEGWQVLVEDLGSANGTVVTLPGRQPQRLHAGEPVLIEDGAEIDLGGEIICTYRARA